MSRSVGSNRSTTAVRSRQLGFVLVMSRQVLGMLSWARYVKEMAGLLILKEEGVGRMLLGVC